MMSVLPGKSAWEVSRIANWNTLVRYYFDAYNFALENSEVRSGQPREYTQGA
ncbi:MAG: hypothetical protein MZV63_24940 [Marinilabiliales bacterium]|nr:hypothetical protein [Marinilabiliales bacterium]